MPGLNAIISFGGDNRRDPANLSRVLNGMNYDQSYFSEVAFEDKNTAIFFSGYKGYPRQKLNIGDKTLLIEGTIYNKSIEQVKGELGRILQEIVNGSGKTDNLREFMFSTDGEFIVYYIDNAASTVVIFNDALGRLPAYYHAGDNGFIIARALKFITGVFPRAQFDDNALMEYFLFSAPLGNRTFFKDIYRLMPCSLFIINYKAGQCQKQTLHNYNFDDRWEDQPLDSYVKELHDRFLNGVANRARYFNDRKQILSLSGGLDSRANLMGLLKNKIEFESISFLDFFNLLGRDKPVVKTLEKTYNIKVNFVNLIEENIPYFERMVNFKDGTGLMGTMGSVIYSMEVTEKMFGKDCVFYTGDEGNYITAPRYGGKNIESTEKLIDEILLKNSLSVFSIDDAARLFGKSPKAVIDYLCDYFSGYPEKDNLHKMDRYFFWERSFKFTMENQDRIRLFFWPIAPHYCIQHTTYALKIKNKYLSGWKIYREFLRALDKKSASIKYANFGIALDSPFLPIYLPIRSLATGNETVRRNLLVILRLLKDPMKIGRKTTEWNFISEFRNYLKDLMAKNPAVNTHIDTNVLNKMLADEKYIYKMYLSGNIIKYISLVEAQQQMPETVP